MVFAQKMDNCHIQILKMAPTPSISLNIPYNTIDEYAILFHLKNITAGHNMSPNMS